MTTTQRGPSACSRRAAVAHLLRRADRPADERLRLRHIRRDDERERQEQRAQGIDGVLREQMVAALRHHHRVDDEFVSPALAIIAATAATTSAVPSIPVFSASTPMSLTTLSNCVRDEGGRQRLDALHADSVLRRHRRQDAHAVDAEGGKRLQIRLDARAAAGIGAGDGQRAGED